MSCLPPLQVHEQKFSKLDFSQAYQQMLLSKELQLLTTINTHQGLYRYVGMPFGPASAPAIFRKLWITILTGIPHVILITGAMEEEHLHNLDEVLRGLQQHGITVK